MLRYIRNFNDVHIDFDEYLWRRYPAAYARRWWEPVPMATDPETALVIAGDIGNAGTDIATWLKTQATRFHSIVFVRGNHDYWGGRLNDDRVMEKLRAEGITNVHELKNSMVVIDGVRFMGGTLWTNFNKEDPVSMYNHPQCMGHDLSKIAIDQYTNMTTVRMLIEHRQTRDFIFKHAGKRPGERALVVVTHHAPSEMSIGADRARDTIQNTYYFSEYGNEISYSEIDLWFHGHTHNSVDYMIFNTRVINNPRGYFPAGLNPNFNEQPLVVLPD